MMNPGSMGSGGGFNMMAGKGGGMGAPAQPSFWEQIMARQQAGGQPPMGAGAQAAGNRAQMDVGNAGLVSNGQSPFVSRPGMNMDQMPSANPQLQALRQRAQAMQAGGAMPPGGAPTQGGGMQFGQLKPPNAGQRFAGGLGNVASNMSNFGAQQQGGHLGFR